MSNAQQNEPQWEDLNVHAQSYQPSAMLHVHLLHGREEPVIGTYNQGLMDP